jgi:hypothetical protein
MMVFVYAALGLLCSAIGVFNGSFGQEGPVATHALNMSHI